MEEYNALGSMIMTAILRSNMPYLTDPEIDPPRWVYVAAKLHLT